MSTGPSATTAYPPALESTVRRANLRDAAEIAELINRAFEVEAFFIGGDRTSEAEVRQHMETGEFLVLRTPQGPLAAAMYVEAREGRGSFALLSVAPEVQGSGLGRRLVAVAEAYCRALRCEVMELQVVNVRRELPPWYQRLGYRQVGTEPFPPLAALKRPCHFIRMSKVLA
jgi:N-acetylglutamate synthase-like GNAT family acetyltransferase